MNKKIALIICTLLYACGFQPMLQNVDSSKLNIQKINYYGKNELNYLIKNYLNIENINNSKGLIVNLSSLETTSSTIKNTSGITTEEDINISIEINIKDSENNNLLTDNVNLSKRLTLTTNLSSDEDTRRIERDKIIKNLTQKIKFKLLLISKQYK